MLGDPHFFSADHFLFWLFPPYYKTKKVCTWEVLITIQIGSNWYLDTGVRHLEVGFFNNSTWFNDIRSKDLSNRPIYVVLNTYLRLLRYDSSTSRYADSKSPRVTGNHRNVTVCNTPYLQNDFGDPRFFYVVNIILSFLTCSQGFKKICIWEIWARTSLRKKTRHAIHWIVIYLVDRIIHLWNNPSKGNK